MEFSFLGWDSKQRPVYSDENGKLWKDTDPRSHVPASLYSTLNNEFEGKPEKLFRGATKFSPRRMTW